MTLWLCLVLLAAGEKRIEVRFTEAVPRIDGRIEEIWFKADTADDFVQTWPDEEAEPTERTEVFVLQDADNLYVAWRCWSKKAPPVGQLYGMEDEVTLHIDPMDSKSIGYWFKTYGSGLYHDGMILDNGANWDWSWEGVWSTESRLYQDRLEVEMKIPFKSIRYRHGATEWGVDFERFIAREQENDHWVGFKEEEGGLQVSKFGRLSGIRPQAHGYYFELLPEGFVRRDEGPDEPGRIKPRASLNFKWDLTSQTTLNATVLPDFAQIESDPFQFNLSQYELWLSERRPFFVEGGELFKMTSLGDGPFSPLDIFYSRRIGMRYREERGRTVATEVPILSGLKLTARSAPASFGVLAAYTDEFPDSAGVVLEPRRSFGVLSGKAALPDNSNLGLLYAGTATGKDDYNYVLGADWGFCAGPHRGTVQSALSDDAGRVGWALNSGYTGFLSRKTCAFSTFQVISDSFSVDDIGYVPWAGRKQFTAGVGPMITGSGPGLRRMWLVPGLYLCQEPRSSNMSYGATLFAEPNFKDWGLNLEGSLGHAYEVAPDAAYHCSEIDYFGRNASISGWHNSLKHNLNLGGYYQYGYNYNRGWLAANYADWVTFTYYIAGRVAVMLWANNWWECNPDGEVVGVTSALRPKVDFRINARIAFNVYSELVFVTPETRFRDSEQYSNRLGFLFSWNFMPKSWLYVALNDYERDRTLFEDENQLQLESRIAAVKLRYLFYF